MTTTTQGIWQWWFAAAGAALLAVQGTLMAVNTAALRRATSQQHHPLITSVPSYLDLRRDLSNAMRSYWLIIYRPPPTTSTTGVVHLQVLRGEDSAAFVVDVKNRKVDTICVGGTVAAVDVSEAGKKGGNRGDRDVTAVLRIRESNTDRTRALIFPYALSSFESVFGENSNGSQLSSSHAYTQAPVKIQVFAYLYAA